MLRFAVKHSGSYKLGQTYPGLNDPGPQRPLSLGARTVTITVHTLTPLGTYDMPCLNKH